MYALKSIGIFLFLILVSFIVAWFANITWGLPIWPVCAVLLGVIITLTTIEKLDLLDDEEEYDDDDYLEEEDNADYEWA